MALMTSKERIKAVFDNRTPDRPPVFDLLANDALVSYLSGKQAGVGDELTVYQAYGEGLIDATRQRIFVPLEQGSKTLEDGRILHSHRWTQWLEPMDFVSVEDAVEDLKSKIHKLDKKADSEISEQNHKWLTEYNYLSEQITPCVLIGNTMLKIGLMSLYETYGWEIYSLIQADHPELVEEYFEKTTIQSIRSIELMEYPKEMLAVITCMDIAGKNGPLVSPAFLKNSFFSRLKRIVDAYHNKGLPFIFHSDGNLTPVMDELVNCGIDGLNPIDVAGGMDVKKIREPYPDLILVGGVDAVHLLPQGDTESVKQATADLIKIAGTRILVGSTTEVGNDIPLENYLAMIDAIKTSSFENIYS